MRGEYLQGLYYDVVYNRPFRWFISGTHYLTQHGLDGLPAKAGDPWVYSDEQLFVIETKRSGLFTMSMREWLRYFSSGKNQRNLASLAITRKEN